MYAPMQHTPLAPAKDHPHDIEHAGGMWAPSNAVAAMEASVRQGFLRKVFGLLACQLALTAAVAGLFMYNHAIRHFVLHSPSLMMVSFFVSIGFLFGAQANKDSHPTNLYMLLGFTLSIAWSVGVTCATYAAAGYGFLVLEAVGLTASVTAALTVYTLRSKQDFSYLGASLGSSLWVLIIGGLIASLTGATAMHSALAVGGAMIFSLYIVYDVHEISKRMSPDEYVGAAISLYLDIINLFLHILQILASLQQKD
jgi:FtsH-binding integral membrane protein